MKRDNDHLRDFLFEIEGDDNNLIIPDTIDRDIKRDHHVHLLCDAGYLVQVNDTSYRLTSQGHDFIDAIRDKGVWEKTKEAVAETGGNAPIEFLKSLALGFLKKKLAEHTGLEL